MFTMAKAILISKKDVLINKYKFFKLALDKNFKTFVIHLVALEAPKEIIIYFFQTT